MFCSQKPTLKKVSKYENKFAKLQKKAAEFNFRNQLKVVKKKEFTLEEEDKEVSVSPRSTHVASYDVTWQLSDAVSAPLIASALARWQNNPKPGMFPAVTLWEVIPLLYLAGYDHVPPRKSKKEIQVFKECRI